jgi:hypothetical protein
MSEGNSPEIAQPKNETTKATQGWFKKNAENIKKWVSNTLITGAGEFFTIMGGALTPFSIAATLITANPLFLLGVAPSIIGPAIEWGGAKNAGGAEKAGFIATKLAMAGGAMYVAPSISIGISAASGLAAQRHRI